MKSITRSVMAVVLLLTGGSAFAQFSQVWNAEYQHTLTSDYSNEGRRIVMDPNGNIFVLSDVTSDIDPFGGVSGGTYYYVNITRYSTNGVLTDFVNIDVHDMNSSGYSFYSAFGLECDASGNIYVGYNTFSNMTSYDVVLEKYSNSLALVWTSTFATPFGDDQGVDMKLHPSGELYAIAKSTATTTEYFVINGSSGSSTASVVLQNLGNGTVLNSLALDGAQKAYVAGYNLKGTQKNAYVAAVDIPGASLDWWSAYSPKAISGDDVATKITVGVDGNIYTVGYSYMGGALGNEFLVLKNEPGRARFDFIVVLKGDASDERALHVYAGESGWVYIGGVSNSEAIVARIPDDGIFSVPGRIAFSPVPSTPFTSVTGITMASMKVSSAKNIYVTGGVTADGPSGIFTSSYLNKGAVVFGNALIGVDELPVEGDFDFNFSAVDLSLDYSKTDVYMLRNFWHDIHDKEKIELIDINVPSPLRKALSDQNGNIILFPNPASGKVIIKSEHSIQSIEIMNLTGNRVLYTHTSSANTTLDISSLSEGVYICKVRTGTGETIKRLVIN